MVARAESSLRPSPSRKSFFLGFEKRLNEIFPCQFLLEAKNSSLLLRAVSKGLTPLRYSPLLFFFLFCLSSCVSFSLVSQELRACAPRPLICFWCISVTVPTGLARVQHHFQGFHAIAKHIFLNAMQKQRNSHRFSLNPQGLDVVSLLRGAS